MGQKVRPTGVRVGITENWSSRWVANKQRFGAMLVQDFHIRRYIKREYEFAGIPKIEIERDMERVHIILHTSRPGVIIGRKGAKVDKLKEDLEKICGQPVELKISEIANPELNAQLAAEAIAQQLLRRAAARDRGALGIKIQVGGRLGGSEMARSESFSEGKVPLQTLQAKIDYGFTEAFTTYGAIGIKVWIYHGPYDKQEGKRHGAHAKKG